MQFNNFNITPQELPDSLPIFPLTGILLLPNIELPLNIFEPRYINMVDDALATKHKLIGLAQPNELADSGLVSKIFKPKNTRQKSLYNIGCAGKIKSYSETEDGRYLITLQGICRFEVGEEISTTRGYRRFKTDFSNYHNDIQTRIELQKMRFDLDRKQLVEMVDIYLKKNNIEGSINNLQGFSDLDPSLLVDFLCTYLPFIPQEKQLFLEASTAEERSRILFEILNISSSENDNNKTIH